MFYSICVPRVWSNSVSVNFEKASERRSMSAIRQNATEWDARTAWACDRMCGGWGGLGVGRGFQKSPVVLKRLSFPSFLLTNRNTTTTQWSMDQFFKQNGYAIARVIFIYGNNTKRVCAGGVRQCTFFEVCAAYALCAGAVFCHMWFPPCMAVKTGGIGTSPYDTIWHHMVPLWYCMVGYHKVP